MKFFSPRHKKIPRSLLWLILTLSGFAVVLFFLAASSVFAPADPEPVPTGISNNTTANTVTSENPTNIVEPKPIEAVVVPKVLPVVTTIQDVPFTSQSPLKEWSDKRQQDACEEASALMAVAWARGTAIGTPQKARDTILAAYAYEVANFKNGYDTNAEDTANHIIKGYFSYENAETRTNIKIADIIQEIMKGNVVITPMNGQALKNPYFTSPGPERHMLLIRGYDAETREFITNDPGTSRGEGYRYKEQLFFDAIREYPSGDHVPIIGTKKSMIVVSKVD